MTTMWPPVRTQSIERAERRRGFTRKPSRTAEGVGRGLSRVHRQHWVVRAGFTAGKELVVDLAPSEQPASVHPNQLILIDAVTRQRDRAVGAAVGHLEPEAGVPRPVAFDADRLVADDVAQLGRGAAAVLENLADPF